MKLSDQPTYEIPAGEELALFRNHIMSVCDELGLDYDVLEPRGWTVRKLPDGRLWASHPAGGNSERWDGRWTWHGESTNFIRSGLAHI